MAFRRLRFLLQYHFLIPFATSLPPPHFILHPLKCHVLFATIICTCCSHLCIKCLSPLALLGEFLYFLRTSLTITTAVSPTTRLQVPSQALLLCLCVLLLCSSGTTCENKLRLVTCMPLSLLWCVQSSWDESI